MKSKIMHPIGAAILFMAILAVLFVPAEAASGSAGYVDAVTEHTIRGWAYDSASPDKMIDVHIYIYGGNSNQPLLVAPARADMYRGDLVQAGYGNGYHGFVYDINWDELPGADMYRVEVFAITDNGNFRLSNVEYFSGRYNIVASLGTFQATAYCACRYCTWGTGLTYMGTVPVANHTISVDTSKIPLGTKLLINGVVYTAEDKGGGIKGNHVDIYFNTHKEALNYGRKNVQVFIVE